jgi:hypothetical protein
MSQHSLAPDPQLSLEAELHASLEKVQAVEALCKAAFLPLLRDHAVTRVEIHYDGGGDEGSMTEVAAYDAGGEADLPSILCDHHSLEYDGTISQRAISLEDALSGFAENAICARHCGWENGEGAYGTLVIDAASGAVTLTHNLRFIDYETSEAEL